MKLLFDENLSFRLAYALQDIYPGSTQVRDIGLLGAEDKAVWEYAAEHGFLLVSNIRTFTNAASCTAFHQKSFGYALAMHRLQLRWPYCVIAMC